MVLVIYKTLFLKNFHQLYSELRIVKIKMNNQKEVENKSEKKPKDKKDKYAERPKTMMPFQPAEKLGNYCPWCYKAKRIYVDHDPDFRWCQYRMK